MEMTLNTIGRGILWPFRKIWHVVGLVISFVAICCAYVWLGLWFLWQIVKVLIGAFFAYKVAWAVWWFVSHVTGIGLDW